MGFLRVREPTTATNRTHMDFRVAGEPPWDMAERERLIRAKAAELATARATPVREPPTVRNLGDIVMLEPEGNSSAHMTVDSQESLR